VQRERWRGALIPNMMVFFDRIFDAPEENLACDEALLDVSDEEPEIGFLRVWESKTYFVVLGYGKDLDEDTYPEKCAALGIPVRRRCSGGGTVLQGPGCLNYALVLPIQSRKVLETISQTNVYIMEQIKEAFTRTSGMPVQIHGFTDLTVGHRKFSGNAQRRKRNALLFHGSFLIEMEMAIIDQVLRAPRQQPEYRAKRDHLEFLTNVPLNRSTLIRALQDSWDAHDELPASRVHALIEKTDKLARTKYADRAWNERS